MVAARARGMYDEAAKERQKRKPADSVPENLPEQKRDARDAAGKALGVSGKTKNRSPRIAPNERKRVVATLSTMEKNHADP